MRRGIDQSFIAPSENVKFSLSKQGALCRLGMFVQVGYREGCHVGGLATSVFFVVSPACRRIVDKRIDACYFAVGARQDEQLSWKQMRVVV
jgi:hypothetical protein